MRITEEQLNKFKQIYKDKFGKDLSDKQALDYGLSLLNFMKILLSNNSKLGK